MFTSGNGRKRQPLGDTDGKRSSARLRGKISKRRTDSAEPKPKGGLSSAGASATKENAPNGTADAFSATKVAPLLDAPTPPPVPAAAALIFMTKKELRAEINLRKIEVKKSATRDGLLEKLGLPINKWNSFRTMKVSQLKEVLRSRGKPVTGKKDLLLERLGVPRGYGQPKWERDLNEEMRQRAEERKESERRRAKEEKEEEEEDRKWKEKMKEERRVWKENMKQMEEERRQRDKKWAEEQRQRDKKWAEQQRRWAEEDRKWLEKKKKWNEEMEERERKEAEEEKKQAEEDRKLEEEARKRDEEHRQFMEKHRQWMKEHRERREKREGGTEEILERARSSLKKAKHAPPEDDPSDESPSIQSHSSDVEAYNENCSSDSDSSTDMDDEDDDEKDIISDEDLFAHSSDVKSCSEDCSSDSGSSTDTDDEDDDEKYTISDEGLFGETPRKECEHCKVRLEWDSCNANYQLCCGKEICNGCMYSRVQTGVKSFVGGASMDRALESTDCPFCGVPGHDTDEEAVERLHKLLEKDPDDGHALHFLAFQHANGNMGLPRDMVKANELWTKAGAELGFVDALNSLANSYKMPRGGFKRNDKKALYYYQCAAMKGHMQARYNCGIFEEENGNMKRAAKHFIISLKGGFNKLNLAESKVRLLHKEGHVSQEKLDDALEGYKKYKDEVMTDDRRRARYRWGI